MLLGQIQSSRAQQRTLWLIVVATLQSLFRFASPVPNSVVSQQISASCENLKQRVEMQPAAKNHLVEVRSLILLECRCAAAMAD
jgi:hypothetical protein